MQVPPRGVPRPGVTTRIFTRSHSRQNLLQNQKEDVLCSLDADSEAGLTAVEDQSSIGAVKKTTVSIRTVTQHIQTSEKRPSGLDKGQDGAVPVKQGRVGLWTSGEEEELKRLVSAHTDAKGNITWVKVMDAWNSLKLPVRSKASLSSKWSSIRSRTTLLDLKSDRNGTVLCRTPDTTQEVNIAVKSKKKSPVAAVPAPAPVKNSLNLVKTGDCPKKDIIDVIFKKHLKNARRIGCQAYRTPPKRVMPGNNTQTILNKVDTLMREEVDRKVNGDVSWDQLSVLVYAGAMTVDEVCNQASDEKRTRSKIWFNSTYQEIDKLRKIIGKASAELNRRKQIAEVTPTVRQLVNIRLLEKKYKCKTFVDLTSLVEKLKGRLQLLLSRIELRKADEQRSYVRHMPTKMIFRDKESKDSPDTVNINQIRRYWKKIVGVKKSFEHNNPLLVAWKQSLPESSGDGDLRDHLTLELWQKAVSKTKSWKAPGPDGLQTYWWKSFKTANALLHKLVHHHLTSGVQLPHGWICNGRIILLFKSGSRSDPANYRPIACLNTCYKLLTGYVTAYLNKYVTERQILAKEQRALQKGVWGCTHALILDQTLIADSQNQKQNPISVGWIDYAKAFDSVPHAYIQWLFKVMQVPKPLRKFLEGLMKSWKVKYEAKSPGGKIESSSFLRIRSGVLQGDSFSPLLFCLAMVPISHALNNTNSGYKTASGKLMKMQLTLTHQFYMDDLKLYADSKVNLKKLLLTVEKISSAISMKVNSKKCAVAHYTPKRLNPKGIKRDESPKDDDDIQSLEGGLFYKYLGMDQEFNTKESFTWDRVKDRCIGKFIRIWVSDLTFRQKVDTHNSTIIPALTYVSSNIIKGDGKYEEMLAKGDALDTKLRAILVKEKARYKAAARSRLYVSVDKGGCGLKSIRDAIEESTIYTWAYLCTRADLKASYHLFERMANRGKRSIISDATRVLKQYNIDVEMEVTTPAVIIGGVRYEETTQLARHVVELMRNANNNKRYEEWKDLKLASRVLRAEQTIDLANSFEWLRKGRLSSIGVRNAIAVQEGCLLTRCHPTFNNTGQGTRCRKCGDAIETIEHVVSCCKKWLTTLYIDRHDSVARNIHYILCRKFEVQPPHYTQKINPVIETDSIRLYWNQPVQTRTIIRHNKPDLVVFDKVKKTALIIEVAVSWFTGIEKQKQIKINRYSVNGNCEDELTLPYPRGDNLVKELSSMGWSVTFIPVIIGVTGEVLLDLIEEIKDKLSLTPQASLNLIERLQRSAVLGTSRIVQNHLST
jgi:hypothetical protein